MASIETAVRAMLLTGTTLSTAGIADGNVTHGYRLQDAALPACTYELDAPQELCIGASGLKSVAVEVRIVASTTNAALAFVSVIRALAIAGTYDSHDFHAVIWNGHTVDAATVADGDEAQPAEVACRFDIYYED